MELSQSNLHEIGAFSGAPIKRQITWSSPKGEVVFDVYVRPLSYHSAVSGIRAASEKKDHLATRIASSIVDESGNPIFTSDQITGHADPDKGPLDGNLTMALLEVIAEVNNLGKTSGSAN